MIETLVLENLNFLMSYRRRESQPRNGACLVFTALHLVILINVKIPKSISWYLRD